MDDETLNKHCEILRGVASKYADASAESKTIALAARGLSHIFLLGQFDRFLAEVAESERELSDAEAEALNLQLFQKVQLLLKQAKASRGVLADLIARFPVDSKESQAIKLASEALGFVVKDIRVKEFDEHLGKMQNPS